MARRGIELDYKKKRRQMFIWKLMAFIFTIMIPILSFFAFKHNRDGEFVFMEVVKIFYIYNLTFGVVNTVHTTYVVLIQQLGERFDILNSLLRCFQNHYFSNILLE